MRGAGGYLQASVKGKHMFGLTLEANVSWIEWLGKIQADSSTIQPMAEQQDINNLPCNTFNAPSNFIKHSSHQTQNRCFFSVGYMLYKIL